MTARVLHIGTEHGWRGGERQTLWLARELARRGHVSIVAARTGEPLARRAEAAGLEVVACNPRNEVDPVAARRIRRAIRAKQIDIVHAHTAHAVATAALATLGTGVPFVVARRVDFALRNNVGTRLKYARAAKIIAVSQAVADVLVHSGMARERIVVVPDGVDVHRHVEPASRERLSALGVREGGPLIVQVSALVGHKDPVNFVRAVARVRGMVPTAQALLVGEGGLREEVEAEVERLGLSGVLHVTGFQKDADALLAAADVVCLSSKEEGMGSVLLDALAFGRPVAATRAGGIPEVVVDGVTGLLAPPSDPRSLGEMIGRILGDRELASTFSRNALARVDEFSVERMTDRTIAVYDSVARQDGVIPRSEAARNILDR